MGLEVSHFPFFLVSPCGVDVSHYEGNICLVVIPILAIKIHDAH